MLLMIRLVILLYTGFVFGTVACIIYVSTGAHWSSHEGTQWPTTEMQYRCVLYIAS